MFIRLVRTTGSADPAERAKSLELWKQRVEPQLAEQKGYLGAIVLRSLDGPEGATASYWADAASLAASISALGDLSSRAPQVTGRTVVDIDSFEVAFAGRAKPIGLPSFLRSNDLVAEPAKVEAGIAMVREKVYPAVSGQPGFRSLLCAVNRTTGRTIVSTTWESIEDLERSEAAVVDLRETSRQATGAVSVRVEKWEAVFANVQVPTGVQA